MANMLLEAGPARARGLSSWRSRRGAVLALGPAVFVVSAILGLGAPDDPSEVRRISDHLSRVEGLLRARDVAGLPPALVQARARNLDELHAYWTAGRFPHNTCYPGCRVPCFIDVEGRTCAVAQLMIASGAGPLAARIARTQNYASLDTMDAAELGAWIESSGLTQDDLCTIQPTYGYYVWDARTRYVFVLLLLGLVTTELLAYAMLGQAKVRVWALGVGALLLGVRYCVALGGAPSWALRLLYAPSAAARIAGMELPSYAVWTLLLPTCLLIVAAARWRRSGGAPKADAPNATQVGSSGPLRRRTMSFKWLAGAAVVAFAFLACLHRLTTGAEIEWNCGSSLRQLYTAVHLYVNQFGHGRDYPPHTGEKFWLCVAGRCGEAGKHPAGYFVKAPLQGAEDVLRCPHCDARYGRQGDTDFTGPAEPVSDRLRFDSPIACDKEGNHESGGHVLGFSGSVTWLEGEAYEGALKATR